MKNIKAVFRREFKAYFDSPVAYVFLTTFLVLAGFLTFGVAMFFERRQADLTPAAAHAACYDHRSPRRQIPRRVELRRHRPRADVPRRSHGRLPRLARLGRRVLRLPRLAAPLWRGSRDRRVRVHSVALVRRRLRRVARARVPASDHRLRPGDRRGRRVGRPDRDNRFRRVLLAPLALRVPRR